MESNEPIYPSPRTNRHSITSLILGILTVITLCGAMSPIPFTGFLCIPISFLLGLFSLIYGAISLNSIRRNNETGSFMAWTGILTGGLIFLCMVCMIVAVVSTFILSPDTIQPYIPQYGI